MPHKRCNQCKKRMGNFHIGEFCSSECEGLYNEAADIFCKMCNTLIGKSSVVKNKQYCNSVCHNNHQSIMNMEERECIYCKKTFIIKKSSHRYKLCSDECDQLYIASKERNDRRMETLKENNLKKFNVEHIFSLPDIRLKSNNTKLEKYGNSSYNNVEKGNKTKLEKYGTLDVSEKSNKTKLEKYGTLNVNDKSNVTKLEKYGSLNFTEKANKTKMEKYGTLDFSDKAQETINIRYGSLSNILLKNSYNKLKEKYKHLVDFLFSESDYIGAYGYKKYNFKCKICNSEFLYDMCNGRSPECNICYPKPEGKSTDEKGLLEYIQSIYNNEILENDRTILDGKEIDIYVPTLHLGIELNGLYWHSELAGGKDRKYHLNKTNLSFERGIKLLHILDWEWKFKKDIIKSILLNKIGKSNRIYARKCIIKEVTDKDKFEFLEKNHIQGNDRSSVRLGLYYQDKLVSLMTFVKSRYDKKYEYELSRYCNSLNNNITGGASKLFQHFIKHYSSKSIVTYADKRLFDGNVYKNIGMTYVNDTPPGYHYFHKSHMVPLERLNFQKHKLSKKLENFDPNLSEWKNMQLNGYDRIWDCGHLKYEWINPEFKTIT